MLLFSSTQWSDFGHGVMLFFPAFIAWAQWLKPELVFESAVILSTLSLSENLKELESKTPSAINGVITTQPYGGASCRNILSQNLRPSTTSKCRGACGALSRSICRLKPHRDPVGDGGGLVIGPS